MTPIHKVWSWSLGGQGVNLTGARMFMTPVSIAYQDVMARRQSALVLGHHCLQKSLVVGSGGGGTVKIASTPNSSLRLFKLS